MIDFIRGMIYTNIESYSKHLNYMTKLIKKRNKTIRNRNKHPAQGRIKDAELDKHRQMFLGKPGSKRWRKYHESLIATKLRLFGEDHEDSVRELHLFSFKSPTKWAEMNETSAADCASTSYAMRNGVNPIRKISNRFEITRRIKGGNGTQGVETPNDTQGVGSTNDAQVNETPNDAQGVGSTNDAQVGENTNYAMQLDTKVDPVANATDEATDATQKTNGVAQPSTEAEEDSQSPQEDSPTDNDADSNMGDQTEEGDGDDSDESDSDDDSDSDSDESGEEEGDKTKEDTSNVNVADANQLLRKK